MKAKCLSALFCSIVILSSSLFCQNQNKYYILQNDKSDPLNKPKQKVISVDEKPGHIYSTVKIGDSVLVSDADMTEMLDVIVEFKEPPLFIKQKETRTGKLNAQIYKAFQSRFQNDLAKLYGEAVNNYKVSLQTPQIKREYYKLFNGTSLRIPRALLLTIASLNYVKKVHPEKVVSIDLGKSISIIGADSVWKKYNNKGDSIVVGIIDTGIDYLHPALGGGIGKGYKVLGGYDFINHDSDPMDDHGHGTHVSGIVAGNNDTIQGVAPNALLIGFKVLNSKGSGTSTEVIAGIERAVDPNDDDNYDDRVDIANMSLGGEGTPDDPQCTAVNNAVAIGTIFCVAAGNSGAYNSIKSPAAAASAITVGASTKDDQIAYFSSKGPNKINFSIKPDVTAPGTEIYSSVLNGSYIEYSGTSMASPHVAGLCALLKKEHKDWTPGMIKSALMTTAKSLKTDVMAQGAGRIDAVKSIGTTSFAIPSSLCFGIDTIQSGIWFKNEIITFINKDKQWQSYNISFSGLINGIIIDPGQNTFSLAPGEEKRIIFNLSVDNGIVKNSTKESLSYSGFVKIAGTKDTLTLPWAFVKARIFMVNYDLPPSFSILLGTNSSMYPLQASQLEDFYRATIVVPEGKYSLWTQFIIRDSVEGFNFTKFVTAEDIYIEKIKEITINSNSAKHTVILNGVDEKGIPFHSQKNSVDLYLLTYPSDSLYYQVNFDLRALKIVYFSDLSEKLRLATGQVNSSLDIDNKARAIQFPTLTGLNKSYEFTNNAADYKKFIMKLSPLPDKSEGSLQYLASFSDEHFAGFLGYSNGKTIKDTWEGEVYLAGNQTGNQCISLGFSLSDNRIGLPLYRMWMQSGLIRRNNDSVCAYIFRPLAANLMQISQENPLWFGEGIVFPWTGFTIKGKTFSWATTFYGALNEANYVNEFLSDFEVTDSLGKYYHKGTSVPTPLNFPINDGKYFLSLKNVVYTLGGIKGKGTLKSQITFPVTESTVPPTLTSLRILNSNGLPASRLSKGAKAEISFSCRNNVFYNYEPVNTARLFLKDNGSKEWKEIKPDIIKYDSLNRTVINTKIPQEFLKDSSAVDLKIFLATENNNTEWIAEPAFLVGNYITSVEIDSVENTITPQKTILYNNFPNPFNPITIINYELTKNEKVELKIYDLLGREVQTLINMEQPAGKHSVNFDAKGFSSGVYYYRLKAGSFISTKKMIVLK